MDGAIESGLQQAARVERALLTRKLHLQRLLKKHQRLIYVDHIESRGLRCLLAHWLSG